MEVSVGLGGQGFLSVPEAQRRAREGDTGSQQDREPWALEECGCWPGPSSLGSLLLCKKVKEELVPWVPWVPWGLRLCPTVKAPPSGPLCPASGRL